MGVCLGNSGRLRFSLVLLGLAGLRAAAGVPVLDQLFPIALQVGTTNRVEAVGKVDPWPPKVWVDTPGLTVEATTNQGTLRVIVASDAAIGARFVRLYNDEGGSAPHFLLVTAEASEAEVEPNDVYTKAQPVPRLPTVLNGRLEKSGDVDCYAVTLAAGQTFSAFLEAHTLMSPVDAVLRLVDLRGVEVAANHDDGRTFDPRLVWTAAQAGTYVLQVFGFDYPAGSDIRFAGNSKCVYRLYLNTGPYLTHTLPLGVQRGANTSLALWAWGARTNTLPPYVFAGTTLAASAREIGLTAPGFVNAIQLPVGDGPELIEQEPNLRPTEAQLLSLPGAVSGVIDPPGDVDRYRFTAREGEAWVIAVQSAALGFPLDAWLRIEDAAGKELVRVDDSDSADPRLDWTAPAGTNFVAAVGGLGRQGGRNFLYRLSFSRPTPGVKATVAENVFSVEAGKTNEIKVTVTRRYQFTNGLSVQVTGLPPGVRAESVPVSEKGGETVLKLIADTNAPAASQPLQIGLLDTVTTQVRPVVMELVSAGENNGVPQGFRHLVRESIESLWLSVRPAPKPMPEKK